MRPLNFIFGSIPVRRCGRGDFEPNSDPRRPTGNRRRFRRRGDIRGNGGRTIPVRARKLRAGASSAKSVQGRESGDDDRPNHRSRDGLSPTDFWRAGGRKRRNESGAAEEPDSATRTDAKRSQEGGGGRTGRRTARLY